MGRYMRYSEISYRHGEAELSRGALAFSGITFEVLWKLSIRVKHCKGQQHGAKDKELKRVQLRYDIFSLENTTDDPSLRNTHPQAAGKIIHSVHRTEKLVLNTFHPKNRPQG